MSNDVLNNDVFVILIACVLWCLCEASCSGVVEEIYLK